jgi:hypothetical protein
MKGVVRAEVLKLLDVGNYLSHLRQQVGKSSSGTAEEEWDHSGEE